MNNQSHRLSYLAVLAAGIACYVNFKDYVFSILSCTMLGLFLVGMVDSIFNFMGYGKRFMPLLGEFCILTLPASWVVLGVIDYAGTRSGSSHIFTFSLNTIIGMGSAAFFWVLATACELLASIYWHEICGFKRIYIREQHQQYNHISDDELE